MGLIFGIIIALGSVGIFLVMIFGAAMSDNPGMADDVGKSAVAQLVVGLLIAAVLIWTHWHPIHIGW